MKAPIAFPRFRLVCALVIVLLLAVWFGNQMGGSATKHPSPGIDWGTLEWGSVPLASGWYHPIESFDNHGDQPSVGFELSPSSAEMGGGELDEFDQPIASLLFQSPVMRSVIAHGSIGVVDVSSLIGDPKKATGAQVERVQQAIADTVRGTSVRWVLDSSGVTKGGSKIVLFADATTDLTASVALRLNMKQRGESSTPASLNLTDF